MLAALCESTWCVYALHKKNSRSYRYVGITTKGAKHRLKQHIQSATRGDSGYKNNWIRSLNSPKLVEYTVLEYIPVGDINLLHFREQFWIATLREAGYLLTNACDGGNTTYGFRHSDERKRMWSESRKGSITGSKNPNWNKRGPQNHMYGRKVSVDTREKLSIGKLKDKNPNYGKKYTDSERAEMSAKTKGIPRPKSARSAHTRYHTKFSVFKTTCTHCLDDIDILLSVCHEERNDVA